MVYEFPAAPEPPTRAARWATRKGRTRRVSVIVAAGVVAAGVATAAAVAVSNGSSSSGAAVRPKLAAAHPTSTQRTTTSKPTTTTTIPPIRQPHGIALPPVPGNGIGWGTNGPVTLVYEQRLKNLHFDPGPVDGVYSEDTDYAVTAVEKLLGLNRDGVIGPRVRLGLEHFKFQAALPKSEADRVEINLDTQVLTVFQNWQPILITTTSTGSGEHFCGGNDGCQYAITPTGHYHFQYLHNGWDKGKLGRMWNPYYFNGGIAVHGLASVPSYPASHGCARIPIDVANYFPSLVTKGESVFVVGTAKTPGSGYVGPAPTTTTSTTVPKTSTTRHRTTTTLHHPTTTAPHSTTSAPHTTTSHGSSTT